MYLNRSVDIELESWKNASSRKPLIIRGARQVGKSSSIRNLGKTFTYFVEVNFDENSDFKLLFEANNSIEQLCDELSLMLQTPIIAGETLLFLDEIQLCEAAINRLRYFYEKMPNLHVIAAGSLLEFALSEIPSFAVGRVRSLFMYPLSFAEFLNACGEEKLANYLVTNGNEALSLPIHHKLTSIYKNFLIVGGMPEAVKTYVETKRFLEVQRVLDDLILSIQSDFSKYKTRISSLNLLEVFNALAMQVGEKFTYAYPNATLNNKQIKAAIELFKLAGLVHSVTHTSATGIPLGATVNPKFTKYLVFDTGIFQRLLGLDLSQLILQSDFNAVNKGNIAELHVGLELIKSDDCYQKNPVYYWQRESKNSQAELDYVLQIQEEIVPIEVKAGTKGSMQSMYLFMKEKSVPKGIRISMENFSNLEKIAIYPLYAAHLIRRKNE